MKGRLLVAGLAGFALVWSGIYVFVYLYRWEWNRAIVSGVFFLAAEVAVIGYLLNGKLNRVARNVDAERAARIRGHLRSAPAPRSAVFDWLDPRRQQAGVFLPLLMGTGLLLSGLAWLVERFARATAGRADEAATARRLSRAAPPPGGFLDPSADPLHDLRGPRAA